MSHPILYSFRRCPYAMRARLAIKSSHAIVELREIVLKNKPESMLAYSPKGTVPVLVLAQKKVIEESLDIMLWALELNDPERCLPGSQAQRNEMLALIQKNDFEFKASLDRYKYADRFPEHPEAFYRQQGEIFLRELELRLTENNFLFGEHFSFADMAIFPFIRQFAHVNLAWFEQANYPKLQNWLNILKASALFLSIMKKYPAWQETDEAFYF